MPLFLGQCLDTIREGKSTVPDAGRGAFATRDFRDGSVVAVAPLVQISDKEIMQTRNVSSRATATQQLLLNYCYGHRKSSLLLCPTSQAAMINHASSRKANVAIRWGRNDAGYKDYTSGSVEDLQVDDDDFESYITKLMFEYVAIGDIQAGDELFLDYGLDWEDALNDHLAHGVSTVDSRHVSSNQLNKNNISLAVSGDESMQYHGYNCQIHPNVKVSQHAVVGWEEISSNRAIDPSTWPVELTAWYKDNDFVSWYPCIVKEADNEMMMYNIEMIVKPLSERTIGRRYLHLPRNRIRFVEPPYHSDQHLTWAFRKFIPVSDSIFPVRWREDYKVAESLNLGKLARVEETDDIAEAYEQAVRKAKCGIYIAPSNIPSAGTCSVFYSTVLSRKLLT